MYQHFGVGVIAPEHMTLRQEFFAKFGLIIDFAIENYKDTPIFIKNGLLATSEVNDREATHS